MSAFAKLRESLVQERVYLPLMLLVALGFRLSNLTATSLWMDELYSLMVANLRPPPEALDGAIHSATWYYRHFLAWRPLDWPGLLAMLKMNVHMPLYYLLLNPWLHWFGNDAAGLRSFSAVCSTLMLVPLYFLGKAMGGRKLAVLSLLVGMLAPFQLYYAQEGRMYALSLFWATLSALSLWKILHGEKPWRWGPVYGASLLGGFFTHYMFVFLLGFHVLYALRPGLFKEKWRLLLPGWALLALGMAFWWPVYQAQQQGINEEYHFAKGWVGWARYATALVWQPLIVLAGDNRLTRIFYLPLAALALLQAAFQNFSLKKGSEGTFSSAPSPQVFLFGWIFVPLILQILYDVAKHTHIAVIDRYALVISPALCLMVALALADWSRRNRWTLRALVPAMALLALLGVPSPSPFRDEHNKDKDIRGKIQEMARQARPTDLVMVNGPWGATLIAAYYFRQARPQQALLYWMTPYRNQPEPLPDSAVFKPYGRVWLFRYRANNERGLQNAKDYLQSRYPATARRKDWFLYSR